MVVVGGSGVVVVDDGVPVVCGALVVETTVENGTVVVGVATVSGATTVDDCGVVGGVVVAPSTHAIIPTVT